ncbi:MAG: nitrous oxide-stimulated promoter family protein [Dehalococcoidales bacterium]|nr:nitrous oxide-stimulated promoter family protein [Dehalococcoidales bacterium]
MSKTKSKIEKEKHVVSSMIMLYCHEVHHSPKGSLCSECQALRDYATARTDKCPFKENKPFCSKCKVHCYKPEKREEIRTVMRYSGPRMLFHDPVMAVKHLVSTIAGS